MNKQPIAAYWEHFEHGADIGIRGIGSTLPQAFEQAAVAMTAVVTETDALSADSAVAICCEAPDVELLFVSWINELVYQMAVKDMVFKNFKVAIDRDQLTATAFGESVDRQKHQPAVEIKGATFTELLVRQRDDGAWLAQCVVDV